mgnify:FL=1
MTERCVCCGAALPAEGELLCWACRKSVNNRAKPGGKEIRMDDGIQAQIASIEARCKSNTHRIDEIEADNKALHQLATSVEVLATKQETIEANVTEIKDDVKSLKALPGSRWEAILKAALTAVIAGLVGFALARMGLGG